MKIEKSKLWYCRVFVLWINQYVTYPFFLYKMEQLKKMKDAPVGLGLLRIKPLSWARWVRCCEYAEELKPNIKIDY